MNVSSPLTRWGFRLTWFIVVEWEPERLHWRAIHAPLFSCRLEGAGLRNLARTDGADLAVRQGYDRDCLTIESDELDFKACRAMLQHDRADVTADESVSRKIDGQDDLVQLFNHRHFCGSGTRSQTGELLHHPR